MTANDDEFRHIAALAVACRRAEGTAEALLCEDLASRLTRVAPDVAALCSSLLIPLGSDIGRDLGEMIRLRVGEYDGGSLRPKFRCGRSRRCRVVCQAG